MNITPSNGVTILDPTMPKNTIRVLKSVNELLGIGVKNETGEHLYIEIVWDETNPNRVKEVIVRK